MSRSGVINSTKNIAVRAATAADIERVQAIYAHYVLNSAFSFEEEAPSLDEMVQRWEKITAGEMPYLAAEVDGLVVGYAYASPYRARIGYRFSVENSVYIDEGYVGQGIGAALLSELIAQCGRGPWRQMIAVISGDNDASIRLHQKFGFGMVGVLEDVGYKFGKWWGTTLMQRALP
jgi:L-amino acid N-acyltransferase YncA